MTMLGRGLLVLAGLWALTGVGPAAAEEARRVLLIGNSRTFYNDMPAMLPELARSAGDTAPLEVVVEARSGARFATHLRNPEVETLLAQRWTLVVLQPHSAAFSDEAAEAEFLADGRVLAGKAAAGGSPVAVVANWPYAPEHYETRAPGARQAHIARIQAVTRRLADELAARVIDIGTDWERVRAAAPGLSLYSDTNHPSPAGSYLFALAIYAAIPGARPGGVTYAPPGIDAADAARLRALAAATH
ncbi:SGNH/GDSL hydrolase family protein [Terrihabitans rhizophilus]|uniref:SGNH/GDSL hydrolase family protein n=1 Tax=Terrihabitans rhizophilus TaxID=3092662 RepID=A0ABU4RTV1_9HYPH|nr:SGNH/GDSL hydrolase family protein [Terrihabitans sp. PJ23]MDX6807060.1 SGNH/GDSL hydrolase family protein [Terrihabitans sp. PJ23]